MLEIGDLLLDGALLHTVMHDTYHQIGTPEKLIKVIMGISTAKEAVHLIHAVKHPTEYEPKHQHAKVQRHPESYGQFAAKRAAKENISLGIKAGMTMALWSKMNTPLKAIGVAGIAMGLMHRNQRDRHLTPAMNVAATAGGGAAAMVLASNPMVQNAVKGITERGLTSLTSHLNLNGPAATAASEIAAGLKNSPGPLAFALALPILTSLAGKLASHSIKSRDMTPSRYSQPQNIAGQQGGQSNQSLATDYNPPSATVHINSILHN